MKFWGYLHKAGSINLKRYFESPNTDLDIKLTKESQFVEAVYGPFECDCKENAHEILVSVFKKK